MHTACGSGTVAEIEGVAQFMDCLLYHPPGKRFPNPHFKAFTQTAGGNYAGFSTQLCLSVDMCQNGDKKIHPGNPEDFDGLRRRYFGELFDDRCGVMLLAA